MSLAERSVTSAAWNIGTNSLKVGVLLARMIILARLLPVETFGIYTFALSLVTLTGILPTFGMGGAYLHRAPETADEDHAAAVHFSLKIALTAVWAAGLIAGALLLTEPPLTATLIALTAIYAGLHLTETPRFILTRRVEHRRMATIDLLAAVLSSIVAVWLAWRGATLGALVSTDLIALLVSLVGFYLWRPIWKPRLAWARSTASYYLRFGGKNMVSIGLGAALDDIDDLWTGANLGAVALGFYSRAYAFATYPRRILAYPLNLVAGGTFAEVKDDPLRLSQSFFRTSALLVRAGFLLGGGLALVAPELVLVALGEKWLPMVDAFRLMLIYTLLDPLRVTVGTLFVAIGRPEKLLLSRLVQLAILLGGLFLLGPRYDIVGVALAVDAMLVVGLIMLLVQARDHVTFSATRLFGAPTAALGLGLAAAVAADQWLCPALLGSEQCLSPWAAGLTKGITFGTVYGAVLFMAERDELSHYAQTFRRALTPQRPEGPDQ